MTIIALVAAAPLTFAGMDQVQGKLVCVFPLVNLTAGATQGEYQKPFSDAVSQEFQAVGFSIVPRDTWGPQAARAKVPSDQIREGPQAVQVSRNAGADMAVAGFYRVDADRVLVSVECWDAAAGTLITGFSHTWRLNLGFYNFLHAEISDLVQRVAFATTPPLITLRDRVRVDRITFTSPQDGVDVVIEGADNAGTIKNGTLTFDTGGVAAGTPLRIEKSEDGYHTVWQTVRAMPDIALDPIPKANVLSPEFEWTTGELEGAGVGLRWYPIPDTFFLSLGGYFFTQVPVVSGGTWPLHADASLTLGLYLFGRPESPLRFGLGTGGGAFFTSIPGSGLPVYTDIYIDLLNLWFEYRLGDVKFIARIDLKVPLSVGNYLLSSNNGPVLWNNVLPPVTFGVVLPWL